jgi:hypothetical protein
MNKIGKKKINSHPRFVRWQENLRNQLTFLNNLLIIIAIGIVGYIFDFLKDLNDKSYHFKSCTLVFGLILTICSLTIGIITAISRMLDNRFTLNKIREELVGEIIKMNDLKRWVKLFSKLTWILFIVQIWSFFFGSLLICISLLKLFQKQLF